MVERVSYKILKKINNIEIRHYPEILLASTVNESENKSFRILFEYISGNNKSRKQITMTSPVITFEKIPMKSPVITINNYMAFSLPMEYTLDTAPKPNNPAVSIEFKPKRTLAVIIFSGKVNRSRFEKNLKLLKEKLQTIGIEYTEEVYLFRYNSPFTPSFFRKNEVAIEIKNPQFKFS